MFGAGDGNGRYSGGGIIMASEVFTRDEALQVYYYLRLNRSLEELMARLFRQNKIFGGLYGSLGQKPSRWARPGHWGPETGSHR